jgi:hypothetical protein
MKLNGTRAARQRAQPKGGDKGGGGARDHRIRFGTQRVWDAMSSGEVFCLYTRGLTRKKGKVAARTPLELG